jgi:hypothetical protein
LWGTLAGGVILGVAQAVGAAFDPSWDTLAGRVVVPETGRLRRSIVVLGGSLVADAGHSASDQVCNAPRNGH